MKTKLPRRQRRKKSVDTRPTCCRARACEIRAAVQSERFDPNKAKHPLLEQVRVCPQCSTNLKMMGYR